VPAVASRKTLDQLFIASNAARWGVTFDSFAAAIAASINHRFGTGPSDGHAVDAFVRTLHVEDLGLVCACRDGHEGAWEHFIRELRPSLYAAARALAGEGRSRELADSLFAELFGLSEKGDERRSLLAYYHGRARLSVWLRTVLAQRHVDAFRAAARTVPLDEEMDAPVTAQGAMVADPHRQEYVDRAQTALDAAVARLDARDRLRLRMYYGEQLAMAQIGRLLGEHEATVSRRLHRARGQLRESVETTLRRDHGMSPAAVRECMRQAAESSELDLSVVLDDDRG
jgi:RNA polymerase sigma-70 factor (ECF subfamily)